VSLHPQGKFVARFIRFRLVGVILFLIPGFSFGVVLPMVRREWRNRSCGGSRGVLVPRCFVLGPDCLLATR
jgi:hypothetical protein